MIETLGPLRTMIKVLTEELARADERFTTIAANDPDVTRLMTVPGIGAITATAYVAALDDAARFSRAGQVASYLGLVPSEYSSGEQQRRGRVLRSAHPQVQSLLVQAAWRMSRSKDPRTASLRAWAQGIARRRGQKIAMVALARRLARILFAMWRDGVAYDGARIRLTPRHGTAPIGEDATKLAVTR
jgi:transposase